MSEWAFGAVITEEDLEAEKRVVIEEWRQGQTASCRREKAHFCSLFANSKFGRRLPAGEIESIQEFSLSAVQQFYRRWYTPRNMAVIAVGPFRPEVTPEKMIAEHFRRQPPGEQLPASSLEQMRPFSGSQIVVFEDDEEDRLALCDFSTLWFFFFKLLCGSVVLRVDCRRFTAPLKTERDFKNQLVEAIFHRCLNRRMLKRSCEPDACFWNAKSCTQFFSSVAERLGFFLKQFY